MYAAVQPSASQYRAVGGGVGVAPTVARAGPQQSQAAVAADPSPSTPQHGKVIPRFRAAASAASPGNPPPAPASDATYAEVANALQRVKGYGLLPTVLTLNYYDLSNDECELIASTMQEKNFGLTSLTLACNRIGSQGLAAISAAVQTTNRLVTLHIQSNLIEDPGVAALSAMLRTNTSIRDVWLSDNKITSKGIVPLAEALITNKTIISIRLDKNQLDNEAAKVFAGLLKSGRNSTLQHLDLRFNDISEESHLVVINQCLAVNFSRPRMLALLMGSRPPRQNSQNARAPVLALFKNPLFDKNILKGIFQFAGLKSTSKP